MNNNFYERKKLYEAKNLFGRLMDKYNLKNNLLNEARGVGEAIAGAFHAALKAGANDVTFDIKKMVEDVLRNNRMAPELKAALKADLIAMAENSDKTIKTISQDFKAGKITEDEAGKLFSAEEKRLGKEINNKVKEKKQTISSTQAPEPPAPSAPSAPKPSLAASSPLEQFAEYNKEKFEEKSKGIVNTLRNKDPLSEEYVKEFENSMLTYINGFPEKPKNISREELRSNFSYVYDALPNTTRLKIQKLLGTGASKLTKSKVAGWSVAIGGVVGFGIYLWDKLKAKWDEETSKDCQKLVGKYNLDVPTNVLDKDLYRSCRGALSKILIRVKEKDPKHLTELIPEMKNYGITDETINALLSGEASSTPEQKSERNKETSPKTQITPENAPDGAKGSITTKENKQYECYKNKGQWFVIMNGIHRELGDQFVSSIKLK